MKIVQKLLFILMVFGSMETIWTKDDSLRRHRRQTVVSMNHDEHNDANSSKNRRRQPQQTWSAWLWEHKGKIIAGVAGVTALGLGYYYRDNLYDFCGWTSTPKTTKIMIDGKEVEVFASIEDMRKSFDTLNKAEELTFEAYKIIDEATKYGQKLAKKYNLTLHDVEIFLSGKDSKITKQEQNRLQNYSKQTIDLHNQLNQLPKMENRLQGLATLNYQTGKFHLVVPQTSKSQDKLKIDEKVDEWNNNKLNKDQISKSTKSDFLLMATNQGMIKVFKEPKDIRDHFGELSAKEEIIFKDLELRSEMTKYLKQRNITDDELNQSAHKDIPDRFNQEERDYMTRCFQQKNDLKKQFEELSNDITNRFANLSPCLDSNTGQWHLQVPETENLI